VIATHGRSFWILDNITPLRQTIDARKAAAAWLYHPLLPSVWTMTNLWGSSAAEEPTAENPPMGAMIDYFLKSPASKVALEVFDAKHKLVRTFSSEDRGVTKHTSLPVAERWFPKPESWQILLECIASCGTSGGIVPVVRFADEKPRSTIRAVRRWYRETIKFA